MPYARNKKNPFLWCRYTTHTICEERLPYHSGRSRRYNFFKGGHYDSTPCIGVELECVAPRQVALLPSNWFTYESDSSINRFGWGVELVSHPIPHTIARRVEQWEEVCNWLMRKGFKSWDYGESGCGLHIHIGRILLGKTLEQQEENLGKVFYLYDIIDEDFKMRLFGRPCGQWCENESLSLSRLLRGQNLNKKKLKEIGQWKNNGGSRYVEINTRNEKTIEFRRGRGSVNAKRIAMVVAFCDMLCIYATKCKKVEKLTQEDFFNFIRGEKKMEDHPILEIL